MSDPLPPDVLARLKQDFGQRSDAVAAIFLAHRADGDPDYIADRLLRCIVHAAHGNETRLQQLIDDARRDYRDVIMAGEYEGDTPVRDLSVSFLIDCPEKFWISEVAGMMMSRGYQLCSLETRRSTVGPFEYTSDFHEGRARFLGPKGGIEIEKMNRQWMIVGNSRDLEIHEMNHAFSDERVFRDAVSCYLLSGRPIGISPRE